MNPILDTRKPPEAEQIGHVAESPETVKREWLAVGLGLVGLLSLLGLIVAVVAVATGGGKGETVTRTVQAAAPAAAAADKPGPTIEQAKGVAFEKYEEVDPTLPAVPAGAVKKFTVDVNEHVVQVDPALAPTKVWTYAVNGKTYKGTAASPPIVVTEGDKVQITLVNGSTKAMNVSMPHSIDFHSAEVDPGTHYVDIAPGAKKVINFTAKHPGVFMYHCATAPVLLHTGNGMAGMMVVKPKKLAPVDKELWINQGEFYLGKPGQIGDIDKMNAIRPDVIAFNGYANQYKDHPITIKKGERVRMYVLNYGPSKWTAFHVIGTVFDKAVVENTAFHSSQTMSLAPSQGGYAEFTLDEEGNYPFVDHAFGDMVKGAAGVLQTPGAKGSGGHDMGTPPAHAAAGHEKAAAGANAVDLTMGEMFIKTNTPTVKAGKVTFNIKNTGAAMHQFAIGSDPLKMKGSEPDLSAAIAKGDMLAGGKTETITVELKPGKYTLWCLMAGHYMAGQKMAFTVQ